MWMRERKRERGKGKEEREKRYSVRYPHLAHANVRTVRGTIF
jgi:hypothetical protein